MFHALDVLASKCRIQVLQATLKITVSYLDAYPSIHVALRITVVSCSTHQLAPWCVRFSTSDPSFRVEFLGPHNTTTKREDATSAYATKEGNCRTWSCCRWCSAQFLHEIQGTVESRFIHCVPHAPRTRLDASVSLRFETSTLGLHNCFKFTAALQLELQVLVTWPDSSGLSALMRPWRCDCLIASDMDLSDPLLRVVNARLHGSPALPNAVSIPSFSLLSPSSVSV